MNQPSTQIWLYNNIPFDLNYKNVVDFSKSNRQAYFNGRLANCYQNILYIEKNGSVIVPLNIGDLKNVNYVKYNNNNGEGDIYAFVANKKYINQGATRLDLKTDIWQTNLNNYVLKDSFVVREHTVTDEIGENVIPEPITCDRIITHSKKNLFGGTYKTLIVLSKPLKEDEGLTTNIYNKPACNYYVVNSNDLTYFLMVLDYRGLADTVIGCYYLIIRAGYNLSNDYQLQLIDGGDTKTITYNRILSVHTITDTEHHPINNDLNGYIPKNKKMFTYPYNYMSITDGETEQIYKYEYFKNINNITFRRETIIDSSPSYFIAPQQYMGEALNENEYFIYNKIVMPPTNSDSYKNYIAENRNSMALGLISSIGSTALGVATGNPLALVGGVGGLATTMARHIDSKNTPEKQKQRMSDMTPLAVGVHISLIQKCLSKEQAKIIDDYFTKFGYATNEIKIPNLTSRPYFNYVETRDANIYGVPYEDLTEFEQIFNKGVTIWHDANNYLNYTVENGVD